jgi:hypothetical protein
VSDVDGRIENDAPGGRAPEAARSQPRMISAGNTFFRKFFVSSVYLAAAALMLALVLQALARAHELGSKATMIVLSCLACIGISMISIWAFARLKRVAMSESSLHVSNFRREIVVPLNDISSVGEAERATYRVWIQFKKETPFGRRIYFIPKGSSSPRPHPIIAELRAIVANADQ